MPYYEKKILRDAQNIPIPQYWDPVADEFKPMTKEVVLSGSKMELYGASLDDRPDATTVPIGTTFTIVDASQEFRSWMSNGTNWGEEI